MPNWITAYFRSGWIFFLPYLSCYLLYAWQGWPAVPVFAGETPASARETWVPPLLHVYWALHTCHLLVGFGVLVNQWRRYARQPRRIGAKAWAAAPWVLLGMLFLLPGVFIEYPADAWEHLRRINAWGIVHEIRDHSHWAKSGYFLAYSLIGEPTSHSGQLLLGRLYYAALGLLLCRQYFGLARALGLTSRPAFLFAILQAILLGNDVFSFYRYYGLSTTVLAQIAAVAAIRYAVEHVETSRFHGSTITDPSAARRVLYAIGPAAVGLLALMAFNHLQAIAIAALGVTGVFAHVTSRKYPSLFMGFMGVVVVASIATVLWWPSSLGLIQAGKGGWLAPWGGFNLFALGSPAAERAWTILGVFGALNLIVGFALVLRNHTAGWLTIVPILGLCVPLSAIPFADIITRNDPANIVAFHRLLLGIPPGLALIVAGEQALRQFRTQIRPFGRLKHLAGSVIALALLTVTPSQGPWLNRFWNLVARSPSDLEMRPVAIDLRANLPSRMTGDGLYVGSSRVCFVLEAMRPIPTVFDPYFYRGYVNGGLLPGTESPFHERVLANREARRGSMVIVPRTRVLFTPYSQAGYLSRHWLPQEVALAFAGGAELASKAEAAGITLFRTPPEISDNLTRPSP